MSRDASERITDIVDAIDRCLSYRSALEGSDEVLSTMACDAILRNVAVIGEAVNRLPEEILDRHPDIDWAAIVGMRNIVVHQYFGVDVLMVRDVVAGDLVTLRSVMCSEQA